MYWWWWNPSESDCTDGIDNDGDTNIDCADSDCSNNLCCSVGTLFECDCSDGLDNDGNGAIDCAETVCSLDPACSTSGGGSSGGNENYTDLVDNDGDGDISGDSDCAFIPLATDPHVTMVLMKMVMVRLTVPIQTVPFCV